jgi:hypothetical protein
MSGQAEGLLKQLLAGVPPGFYTDLRWLSEHGISRQLAHRYVELGWLERVARGLFRRPAVELAAASPGADWVIPVLSAQWIMHYDLHVGGSTALSLAGHTHYLPLGDGEVVYLYSDATPTWLAHLQLQSELRLRNTKLFADPDLGVENAGVGTPGESGYALDFWQLPVKASSPERAILEAIDELPDNEGFHNLDMLFEGLTNLRPRLLTELLVSCRKVQVKRLFLVFADRHDHAWRKHVDTSSVDLGVGDRAFTPGGKLHPDYRITVPAELMPRKEGADQSA